LGSGCGTLCGGAGGLSTYGRVTGPALAGVPPSGVVDRVRAAGWETVGEIVDVENTFLLCYVRGPEGLIVELAERLDGARG
jgi:hypothetical protein